MLRVVCLLAALAFMSVKARSLEECRKGCNKLYFPVCGSDGKLHSNPCTFEVDQCIADGNLEKRPMSFCQSPTKRASVQSCMRPCNMMYNPVCGSDGRLHSNPCTFVVDQCVADGSLEERSMSFCQSPTKRASEKSCMRACNMMYNPVCGSDGKLHSNPCTFEADQCMADGNLERRPMSFCQSPTKRASKGSCMKACNKLYDPVCGSDGKLHSNPCTFEIDQCIANGNLEERAMSFCQSPAKRAPKEACMKSCNKMRKPVCGSDGKTRSNLCLFEIAQCIADGNLELKPMEFCN